MVDGKNLIERGWPEGRVIGIALEAAKELRASGMDEAQITEELEKVREDPTADAHVALAPLVREFESIRAAEKVRKTERLHDEVLSYEVWGKTSSRPTPPPRWTPPCGSPTPSAAP